MSIDKGGNRSACTFDEAALLEHKVLPTAKRWMKEELIGSPLFEHGRHTVEFWHAQDDDDIRGRFAELRADHERRNGPKRFD